MREFIRITDKTLHWFQPLLEEPLIRRLTNPESGTYAIGAVEDKTACGVLVFRMGDPAAEILTLAVSPEYRRRGIARGMVEYLCRHAWATVTPVVCSFAAPDRQDPVYLFFAHLESFSVAPEEGMVCRVPLSELPRRKLAAMGGTKGEIRPFYSLPAVIRRQYFYRLRQQHALLWDELDEASCCRPLCLCAMDGGEIQAVVFMAEDGPDLELSFAWCAPDHPGQLMALLAQVASLLPEREGDLRIAAVTQTAVSLVDKLLPGREVLARYYQAAWDMQ